MKLFVPVVIALVVGIVLGSWQPRGDMLALRAEVDELRAEAKRPCRSGGARTLSGIFRVPEEAPEAADAASTPAGDVPGAPPEPGQEGVAPPGAAPGPARPQSAQEAVGAMKATLEARRAQALQALIEQGNLSEEQVASVEGIMDDMNTELKRSVDAMVNEVVAAGAVDRRDMLDFGADALDIVIAADDRMRATLPPEVYDAVDDETVDPFSYVSGDALESAARLEGIPGFEP
jgi:hypothetical protein